CAGNRFLHRKVAFGTPARRRPRAGNKKAGSAVPPVPADAILVSTLFWKILVTRVNGKYAAHAGSSGSRRGRASCWRHMVPSPAGGGGTGRGHATGFRCARSPPPQPSPASGGGSGPNMSRIITTA